MKKKNRRVVFPFALVLLLLYILLFPGRAVRETVLRPVWSVPLDGVRVGGGAAGTRDPSRGGGRSGEPDLYGYRIGDAFGFFGIEGRIVSQESVVFDVTLGQAGYINFSRVPRNLVYKSPDGRILESFPFVGYPNLDPLGQRVFFLSSESTALSVAQLESEDSWRVEYSTLITSLASNGSRVIVGLLDGRVLVYGDSGDLIHSRRIEGSRIPVILGCAVDPVGRTVAGLAGIDPQMVFLLQERRDGEWTFVGRELDSDLRRESFVRFGSGGRFVFFEMAGGLGVLEVGSRERFFIPLEGALAGVGEHAERALLTVLLGGKAKDRMEVYSVDGRLYVREPFARGSAESSFLKQVGGSIVFGYGGSRLLRVDVREM